MIEIWNRNTPPAAPSSSAAAPLPPSAEGTASAAITPREVLATTPAGAPSSTASRGVSVEAQAKITNLEADLANVNAVIQRDFPGDLIEMSDAEHIRQVRDGIEQHLKKLRGD